MPTGQIEGNAIVKGEGLFLVSKVDARRRRGSAVEGDGI